MSIGGSGPVVNDYLVEGAVLWFACPGVTWPRAPPVIHGMITAIRRRPDLLDHILPALGGEVAFGEARQRCERGCPPRAADTHVEPDQLSELKA